ncbi:NgoMIV family type II restriction endonuclease [Gordonia amicalis]|uniref:NgoMIV family type II restriction endonuclease n=1 Tax=Gordonia amicalis TaxID=89053 RepID=UPI002955A9F8|nr:NgoMIV family type II restriction endonuclease [Gordonia amicalis]MDV7172916.1 NgoMIV family type II restriction endonuclease [Gordonia amicalis]
MKDKKPKNKLKWLWVPNSADVDNATSLRLAATVLERFGHPNPNATGEPPVHEPPSSPGGPLEQAVADDLGATLPLLDPSRRWVVRRGRSIMEYAQYQHLAGVEVAIENDPNLRVTLGTDYLITPDVLVGIEGTPTLTPHPWLHAALACKWTIRSDRVQNIRHENSNMIRHRRGRLPHLATVTAEPLPSRLASIARGTGEVDVTYHIAYQELASAVALEGNPGQQAAWDEVTGQGRLRDYALVARSLVDW